MAEAICINCGHAKGAAFKKCRNCGFAPKDEDARVRSLYLSTGRFDGVRKGGRGYREELDRIGAAIQAGSAPAFETAELERLRDELGVPASAVWRYLFRLFLPAIIFIAILFAIGKFFRVLKHGW